MEKKGGEILERLEMGRRTSQRGGGGLVRESRDGEED